MTTTSIALSLAVFVGIGSLEAQELRSTPVAEPQYINSFFAVDTNGKLIDLERQTVTFHSKAKVLPGYVSMKMTAQFKPGYSSVRLPATAQFIVRGRTVIDPVSRFELRKLKGSKNHREFVMTQGHGSILGGSATSNPSEGAIPIRFEEYGANSYRITPEGPLEPGEYALALRGFVTELYCFGVDR